MAVVLVHKRALLKAVLLVLQSVGEKDVHWVDK